MNEPRGETISSRGSLAFVRSSVRVVSGCRVLASGVAQPGSAGFYLPLPLGTTFTVAVPLIRTPSRVSPVRVALVLSAYRFEFLRLKVEQQVHLAVAVHVLHGPALR